jgi:hypothetical protein
MENLLVQLVKEAKQANPESEAVKTFEYFLDRMSLTVESTLKDVECNSSNNVYENDEMAQDIIKVREALESGDVLQARHLGLLSNTRLDNDIESRLTITFSNHDVYDIEENEELGLVIDFSDITCGEFEDRNMVQVVEDALKLTVTDSDIPYLAGQTAKIKDVYVDCEELDEQVTVELSGYRYALKAVVQHAINKGVFKVKEGWDEDL